jgi:hypothetical protein
LGGVRLESLTYDGDLHPNAIRPKTPLASAERRSQRRVTRFADLRRITQAANIDPFVVGCVAVRRVDPPPCGFGLVCENQGMIVCT